MEQLALKLMAEQHQAGELLSETAVGVVVILSNLGMPLVVIVYYRRPV